MATPCLATAPQQLQSRLSGPKVSFSSKQADVFRQIARETRRVVRTVGPKGLESVTPTGLVVWFSGSGGSGKTLAAEMIARELRGNLYRANLNQVVSKYIGETEKNLTRVLENARKKIAVLFFDEADAIFGKRTDVRDSHDRYANVEVSYLIGKIETFHGLVILSSDRKVDIDPTIKCRVKYLLEFGLPTPSHPLHPRP